MWWRNFQLVATYFSLDSKKYSWASWSKVSCKENDVFCKRFYFNRMFPKWWSMGCGGEEGKQLCLTFSLLKGSTLGLGKGSSHCSLAPGLKAEIAVSPQLCYYKGTVALPRCREVAAAQWDSALCSTGKEGNTTKWTVTCAGIPWLCCAVRSLITEAMLRGWEAEDRGYTLLWVWGTEQGRG